MLLRERTLCLSPPLHLLLQLQLLMCLPLPLALVMALLQLRLPSTSPSPSTSSSPNLVLRLLHLPLRAPQRHLRAPQLLRVPQGLRALLPPCPLSRRSPLF